MVAMDSQSEIFQRYHKTNHVKAGFWLNVLVTTVEERIFREHTKITGRGVNMGVTSTGKG